ncbi:DNA polymerase Y family protein [Microbacterium sp. M]|uniref:DNA polymerase Y family protein n=1 Tax=Microbacterium sp. M TaxID=3377125 RepID=UPI0038705297
MMPPRHLVLWLPDWPVRAAVGAPPPYGPVAVVQANTIIACSDEARAQGVRRGQRRRLAQSRSPALQLLNVDPLRDETAFLPVLRLLEDQVPGVQQLRPGLAALRARGPSRYYGGEAEAASVLIEMLAEHGHPGTRAGVADGLFTAEQAARLGDPALIVPPGGAGDFLAPLPVQVLGDEEITALLDRLGVRRLADFARLGENMIRDRFGERGARLHALAAGADSRPLPSGSPPPELSREVSFETPLGQADQVAFAVRQTADSVFAGLAEASLVCTEVRIDFTDDDGAVSTRVWMHPTSFEAADLVDRVRWQLETLRPADSDASDRVPAGIVTVRIVPTRTDDSRHHQPGLFGQGPEERLHHAVSRVQALLGHRGVVTPVIVGGRRMADRQQLQPWGDRAPIERDPAMPWPGSLPAPHPAEVFAPPRPIAVTAADRSIPTVDARGALSAAPAFIADAAVLSWAGPWPLREHGWDPDAAQSAHRFQIVDAAQRAWLVLWEDKSWWAEGRYV